MKEISPFSRRQFLTRIATGAAALAAQPYLSAAAPSDSHSFGPLGGIQPDAMLDTYLKRLAFDALDRRMAGYELLKSPDEIFEYQRRLRAFFVQQLGGFPERTALNARITGTVAGEGYRVEKVIFESLPGFPVTANLYLPLTPPPYPAVLHSCGHTQIAKTGEIYQRISAIMARNGLAVLTYDPIGQGERCYYLDRAGAPTRQSTLQHGLLGIRCRLAGLDLARFMVWDGIRGIDYLQSRPDILPERIGATGTSGGGTLTSYLMALDDRIACAAPVCYITGFRRLLETIGPQDFEQNVFGQIEGGLDHADYLLLHAPKPTLLGVTTRDFFDIHGAWDAFRQAKRIYTRLGSPGNVDLVEDDDRHGFPAPVREEVTRWMRRWLLGSNDPVREVTVSLPDAKDLLCTQEGQVMLQPGTVSLFQLLERHEKSLQPRRPDAAAIRRVSGIREISALPAVNIEKGASTTRQDRRGETLALQYEPGLWIPAAHFPAQTRDASAETVLYFPDDAGGSPGSGEDLARFLAEGGRLLMADLPGLGETRPARSPAASAPQGHDARQAQLAFLLGRNLVALRAEAILQCALWLAAPGRIRLVCEQQAAVPALHAAALNPSLFSAVHLPLPPTSWAQAVRSPDARQTFADAVPNALTTYDLPDLIAAIPAEILRPAEA